MSMDVGAVEYVPVVPVEDVTDGLLKWKGTCMSTGEVAADVCALGGE